MSMRRSVLMLRAVTVRLIPKAQGSDLLPYSGMHRSTGTQRFTRAHHTTQGSGESVGIKVTTLSRAARWGNFNEVTAVDVGNQAAYSAVPWQTAGFPTALRGTSDPTGRQQLVRPIFRLRLWRRGGGVGTGAAVRSHFKAAKPWRHLRRRGAPPSSSRGHPARLCKLAPGMQAL
ncbi:hypothetical protein SKAU_G00296770 [Synaphobranchus kaupii]|uniref:Secreted protein n=1 Tax=Synaphobranchus kaupii TaxID=118154 RepID=A0A9Q1EUX8_SYNKA|nr:hypothetical protein SKAU_G00296770 [Synaphobranchus kaupii]